MPAPAAPPLDPLSAAGVSDLLTVAARESPDKLALVESAGRSLTWADLEHEVARLATGLGEVGIVAGYRVLLVLGNRLEFVTTYLGVLRAQAVAVPVNPGSSVDEVARIVADCGARMVLADEGSIRTVRAAVAGLGEQSVRPRVVAVGTPPLPGERPLDHLRAERPHHVPALHDPERLAVLLYTSGTSGVPRAAMLTHRALRANIEQVAGVRPPMIHGDDVVLGVLPLFHVYGLNAVLGAVLRQRAKLVIVDRFDAQAILDLIEDEACSVVPVAPPVFAHWRDEEHLAERLGPVRLVLSGSAPLAADVAADFVARTGIPVHQGYGLTEAAPVVTSTLCSHGDATGSAGPRAGSAPGHPVGGVLPGIEMRLLDAQGRQVEGDDPGEIALRGDNLFSGYWPDGSGGPDSEGWWSTGDVGLLDEAGDLVLVDRVKELVIVSGFNVYPAEVEAVVREVEGVARAAVIGVPDELTGEAVVAYVVAGASAGPAGPLAEAVRARCRSRLARFKQPVRVEVVHDLPVTVTGKVEKGRLRLAERRRASGLLQ